MTVDKTGETRLKCGEKPTLLCRTGTKPLTGTAVEKTELNFSSNNSRSNGINYAHKLTVRGTARYIKPETKINFVVTYQSSQPG